MNFFERTFMNMFIGLWVITITFMIYTGVKTVLITYSLTQILKGIGILFACGIITYTVGYVIMIPINTYLKR